MNTPHLISLHGGHSGQYCNHAEGLLEDIIQQYIKLGFTTVGITEHIPPINDRFLYPDEIESKLTALDLNQKFENYFATLNGLKKKYASSITIFTGMETEAYTGYVEHVKNLISKFQPDYIVGSVHHVDDICFDYSREEYDKIVLTCGSHESMYEKYFDLQYEMVKALKPFVVGHFDLIRIYDQDYKRRLALPKIREKVERNLKLIKSLNLIMDFNLRPLTRGEKEPYITESILKTAKNMGIRVVPGDDSHNVEQAGLNVDKAVTMLADYGFDTRSIPVPELLT